jgi:hypothetical protein
MSNLFSSKPLSKPLKGGSVSSNVGVFDTITANTLELANINIAGVFEDGELVNVVMIDSELRNTVIGLNGPNAAYFTSVQTRTDVKMLSNINEAAASWDPHTAQFYISSSEGSLKVDGCSFLGNLEICRNDIMATNLNGDVNIIPNNLGTIYLRGPINNVTSSGNFYSEIQKGSVSFIADKNIVLYSSHGQALLTTAADQSLTAINGDISLTVDAGLSTKTLSSIRTSGGNIVLTSPSPHQLAQGDNIFLTSGSLNGSYTVASVLSDTSFRLTTTSATTITTTGGNFVKVADNNILLNSQSLVKIPEGTRLTFGSTTNAVSASTNGMLVSSASDLTLNVPGTSAINIPQGTRFQFGTSGNNYLMYDGSKININSDATVAINGAVTSINTSNTRFSDPILTLANYNLTSSDNKDRGIEYNYYDSSSGSMKLGWFGFKSSTRAFTFIPDAVNTNETISGTPGRFQFDELLVNTVSLSGGAIDMQCGKLLNTNLITGCSNNLTIAGSTNVTVNATNRIALSAGVDVLIPNNIPLALGTSGSYIRESTMSNLVISANSNARFITASRGAIIIPVETALTFDNTSIGNQKIASNTAGDLIVSTNKALYLTTTGGNVILPANTQLQMGTTSQVLSGNSGGIKILSSNISSSFEVIAGSTVNVSSSGGNIALLPATGDILLYPGAGSVRIPVSRSLIFDSTGTANSITNSGGVFLLSGSGSSGTLRVSSIGTVDLLATSAVNVPTGTKLNVGSDGQKYIYSDATNNTFITNASTSGSLVLTAQTTNVWNTGGSLNVSNTSTNITTSTLTVTGSQTQVNTTNVRIRDPIVTIGDYTLAASDQLDRGVEYRYYQTTTNSMKLGWFGRRDATNRFTFYSDAVNTGEIVSGTMGDLEISSVFVSKAIAFAGSGFLDMSCGTIANVNTVYGCSGVLNLVGGTTANVNAANILLNGSNQVRIPTNVPLSFGSTSNAIVGDTSGTLLLNSGNVVLAGNVQVNGSVGNVYTTVTNIQDPIVSIGGVVAPVTNDNKDRGLEFKWNDGVMSKVGFFGYKANLGKFAFIRDGVNNDKVFSGTLGDIAVGNISLTNGVVSGVAELSGGVVTIKSTSGNVLITPTTGSSVLLPSGTTLGFGSTSNGISASSSGNLLISATNNTSIVSQAGYINLSSSQGVLLPGNAPLYFGATSSSTYITKTSAGSLSLINGSGNIDLTPVTAGSVNLPSNTPLNFGSTSTSIYSDSSSGQLIINGWNGIGIQTSSVNMSGNVNITGTLTATNANVDINKYILPLGTASILPITTIANTSSSGNVRITTSSANYLTTGDQIVLQNTLTNPNIDGTYTVSSVQSPYSFIVSSSIGSLVTGSSSGTVKTNLMLEQGKDVGIQVNYWSTTGNTSITSGSANFKTGFFGFKRSSERWSFYTNASISNNVVSGGLSDIEVSKVYASRMSGFGLDGDVSAGSNQISGTAFQVGGGSINNTPIGGAVAATGRFTSLANTTQALLSNVTLQSNLAYTFERYSLSSTNQYRSPTEIFVVSLFSVAGVNYTGSSGTMPSTNIPDGTFKMLVCSAMGDGCTHTVHFGAGKLITPNPMNSSATPTKLVFKRRSQSAQLIWDNVQAAWVLLTSGCYVT